MGDAYIDQYNGNFDFIHHSTVRLRAAARMGSFFPRDERLFSLQLGHRLHDPPLMTQWPQWLVAVTVELYRQ